MSGGLGSRTTARPSRDYVDRTIATIRNHRDADNCWPQWANMLADEVEAERAARVRAEEALRRIEWIWEQFGPIESDGVNRCPACGMTEEQGHDRSCSTARALAGVDKPA